MIRWPDAIIIANESFYKAVELNKDVKPSPGLLDSKEGQILSAAPIHDLAASAMEKKDYEEAIRLLNMVIRSYKADLKEYAKYLVYPYFDLSNCYKAMGDEVNRKKILIDAAKLNTPEPVIYLNLYEIYKIDKDTVKCGEILTQARKAVPDSSAIHIKECELEYLAMIGDSAKLVNAALKMFEESKNDSELINIVAGYLLESKLYELAKEIIEAGLAIDPNNFDLNQQMTYRYFYEAIDYYNLIENIKQQKRFNDIKVAQDKFKEVLETAKTWAEKAYNISKEDEKHNKMYGQILVRLALPVPEELQKKLDSYRKN